MLLVGKVHKIGKTNKMNLLVLLIEVIHRHDRRARIYVDEENKSQDGSVSDYGSNIDEEENTFQPHNNYASDEEDKNEKDVVVENW